VDNVNSEEGNTTCQLHIGERLGKLEQLFEKFVCRKLSNIDAHSEDTQSQTSTLINEKHSKFVGLPQIRSDAQSISSIGDSIVSFPCPA
jgi:hypothetical protein